MEVRGYPLHFGVQLQGQATSWSDYAAAVGAVEELGYQSVWTPDHLLPVQGTDDRPCFETLTTLSGMALLTKTIRFGAVVNGVLYRDPATLAKAAAELDHMSGGRLEFSLGGAWAEREFRAYGLNFPSMAERYGRLDEALQIVKLLWSEQRTTFHGRYYEINDAPCEPKPLQRPHPPVTVGGSGRGALRIAARHATRLNLAVPAERYPERTRLLGQMCAEIGREPGEIELSTHPMLALAVTTEEAELQAERSAAAGMKDFEADRDRWWIGTPAEVTEQVRAYLAAGVSHFVFAAWHPFDLAPLKLFKEEVIPALS